MTQMILVSVGFITLEEEKELIFELLQDDKQFIYVTEKRTMVYEFADKPNDTNYMKIAINKSQIIQVL